MLDGDNGVHNRDDYVIDEGDNVMDKGKINV